MLLSREDGETISSRSARVNSGGGETQGNRVKKGVTRTVKPESMVVL
jgi:hypothetical protein